MARNVSGTPGQNHRQFEACSHHLSCAGATGAMHPYSTLTPDLVVESIEAVGYVPDGRVLALNSYENRVYQVGRDDGPPVVVKFYRPGRWTTPQILEEHEFALELARAEVPVVPPEVHGGRTLFEIGGFRYAVYRRQGGHWPELGTSDERKWMGRFLGRIHAIGRVRPFRHRAHLDWRVMGVATAEYLLEQGWIPPHIEAAYSSVAEDALALIEQRFIEATPYRTLRLHGTATAIPATCCGPTAGRTSSTWTTASWAPRCRTCGCCSRGVRTSSARNSRTCSKATANSPTSTGMRLR